jgi:hypothetical protein
MNEFTLKNGRKIMIYEFSFSGLADTILHARWSDSKRRIPLKKVLPLLSDTDQRQVMAWQEGLEMYNGELSIA